MAVQERLVMDGDAVDRALTRMAHEILENNPDASLLALVGIRSRGVFIAERLREKINEIEGIELPLGIIDITLYRDDLDRAERHPQVKGTSIPFDVDGRAVLLVDDVLYTGRTVRAALDALVDFGRPRRVQLVVLVDRGHRELPIRPDFVGKNLPTSMRHSVRVQLREHDGRDAVTVVEEDET